MIESRKSVTGLHVIGITGRFDFTCHQEFRAAYAEVMPGSPVIVDFVETTYVDSAALGMLMLLRDHLGSPNLVRIARARGQPDQVLRVANFHRLFGYGNDEP